MTQPQRDAARSEVLIAMAKSMGAIARATDRRFVSGRRVPEFFKRACFAALPGTGIAALRSFAVGYSEGRP